MCHDCITKVVGTRRQIEAVGALPPGPSGLVGADRRRDRCVSGSPHGTARLGREWPETSGAVIQRGDDGTEELVSPLPVDSGGTLM